MIRSLKQVKEDLDSNEYRITVVGEFSSGKSTFLNAMIGMDVLPHGVEETTAAVTYIHNVSAEDPMCGRIKIIFRNNAKSPVLLDLKTSNTALIDYVTAKSERDVVKEIAEVHLYIDFLKDGLKGEKFILIDTPGLNGIKDGMRDITVQEILRSNANISLFNIKGISDSDVEFSRRYYNGGTPFFFVLNQIDRLNEETPEERIETFRDDLVATMGITRPENVFGVSALKALAARDISITRLYEGDDKELTPERRTEILRDSRMEMFEEKLYDFVQNGELERTFLRQIEERIHNIFRSKIDEIESEIEILSAKENSVPGKEEMMVQRKKVEESCKRNLEVIKNKLGSRMADIERGTYQFVSDQCRSISEEAEAIISSWTIDTAEKDVKSQRIAKLINERIIPARNKIEKFLIRSYDNAYDDLVSVVQSFVPSMRFSKKSAGWKIAWDGEIVQDNSRLARIDREMKMVNDDIESEKARLKLAEKRQDKLKRNISIQEVYLDGTKSEKRSELRRLGCRPQYREWEDYRVVKRGGLIGFLFGGTKKQYYTADNQDEIDRYDNEKNQIEMRHDARIAAFQKTIRQLEDSQRSAIRDVQSTNVMISQLNNKLAILKKQRQNELDEIEKKKKYAKNKLLANMKAQSISMVEESLGIGSGELYLALKDDVRKNVVSVQDKMALSLERLYKDLVDKFLHNIDIFISKLEKKADLPAIKSRIEALNREKVALEIKERIVPRLS